MQWVDYSISKFLRGIKNTAAAAAAPAVEAGAGEQPESDVDGYGEDGEEDGEEGEE